MPVTTLKFVLPEEAAELSAAMKGGEALSLLAQIDNYCRGILKYGEPGDELSDALTHIRALIPYELLND